MLIALNVYQNLIVSPGEVRVESLVGNTIKIPVGAIPISSTFQVRLGEALDLAIKSIQESSMPLEIENETHRDMVDSYRVIDKRQAFIQDRTLGSLIVASDKIIGFRYNESILGDKQYRNAHKLPKIQAIPVINSSNSLKEILYSIIDIPSESDRVTVKRIDNGIALEYHNDIVLNNKTIQYCFNIHKDGYYYINYIGYMP